MTHKRSEGFEIVQRMVRSHLADAEKHTGFRADNPGPKPEQCYAAGFATASGAYAGRGITVNEWSELHQEVRDHQLAWSR